MEQAPAVETMESRWVGDTSPLAGSWKKVMMWIFIVTDGLLFAGLLTGYGFVRLANQQWPHQAEIFNLKFIALMTFILISSSATMATAVGAARQGQRTTIIRCLLLTILGGLMFLSCQAYEWTGLIGEGARLYTNPWGVPLFGASFFILTGFHGAHVLTGVTVLALVAARFARRRSSAESIELAGLYWHFVDLVWVFIFTLFYLL